MTELPIQNPRLSIGETEVKRVGILHKLLLPWSVSTICPNLY